MLHGLKQGTEVLKEIHKELNVESVEKLIDETVEAREYQRVCYNGCSVGHATDVYPKGDR